METDPIVALWLENTLGQGAEKIIQLSHSALRASLNPKEEAVVLLTKAYFIPTR